MNQKGGFRGVKSYTLDLVHDRPCPSPFSAPLKLHHNTVAIQLFMFGFSRHLTILVAIAVEYL